ncbi:MAG: hypothetical protein KDA37_11625 [Planctomycetales bacterium]|nr:hypothetical protein [Planctomycetales bacterium]
MNQLTIASTLSLLAWVAVAAAQTVPPAEPLLNPQGETIVDPYLQLAQAPGFSGNAPLGAATPRASDSVLPPGTRDGVFQKLNMSALWMPRLEDDNVGITGVDLDMVFGLPFPERETPLIITPAYRVKFLEGPDFTDLPSRLHDAEVDFHHFRKVSPNLLLDAAVTVGAYGDDSRLWDGVRVSGRGLGIYDHNNGWKSVLGVVYLNRAGYSVLPVAGFTYAMDDLKFDLLFPRPRIAWRTSCTCPDIDERWVYLQGEFGGNIWAVERAGGSDDKLAYRDLRVLIGAERKLVGGISRKWELGYVFAREIEYDSEGFASDLDDAFFLRAGLTY